MVRLITADDGRFLRLTKEQYEQGYGVLIDESTLPEGDLANYKYIDGEWISDPLPAPEEPVDDVAELKTRVAEQQELIDSLTGCILEMSEMVYA